LPVRMAVQERQDMYSKKFSLKKIREERHRHPWEDAKVYCLVFTLQQLLRWSQRPLRNREKYGQAFRTCSISSPPTDLHNPWPCGQIHRNYNILPRRCLCSHAACVLCLRIVGRLCWSGCCCTHQHLQHLLLRHCWSGSGSFAIGARLGRRCSTPGPMLLHCIRHQRYRHPRRRHLLRSGNHGRCGPSGCNCNKLWGQVLIRNLWRHAPARRSYSKYGGLSTPPLDDHGLHS